MAKGYFTTKLSEHREETPEGFLIARDTVLARSGFQTYNVRDLPQESAADMGVDVSNPDATIDLYRRPEDVFAPETLASFEGKTVTDSHPSAGFVTPENFRDLACGHVQNVRRGREPLESGDWPMIGDIHITAEPLLSKVKNNLVREVSLGYDFAIERDGDKICQVDMVGNHAAIVPKGRAGGEARIMDAAPSTVQPRAAPPGPAVLPPEPAALKPNAPSTKKEHKVKNPLMHIFGLGLRAKAADAEVDPEELAQAAMDIGKSARDNEEFLESEAEDKKRAKDRKTRDAEPEEEDEPVPAMDSRRRKMHDALDDMLDDDPEANPFTAQATDADIAELRTLLDQYLGEEEEEPEHAADAPEEADASELEAALDLEVPEEEDEPIAEDDEADPGMIEEPDGEEAIVADRAHAADSVKAALKMLRPGVARSNDKALKAAFNTALAAATRSSRPSTGGYDKFASAARALDKTKAGPDLRQVRARAADAGGTTINKSAAEKLQAAYDAARMGGK